MAGEKERLPKLGEGKKGNLDVLMIAFGTVSEEEVEKFRKTLKEVEEWMNEWTPCCD
ncbi:hypothetical protein E3E35_00775 [Thermococcus sp. GR7]|uniref:antitoxin VapB family protein n=1 Tax=unclassified Thermococcus TaxID=2627626 RepID=UPI00143221AF|nr:MULTISPECIES: antitoxin VapB family protein [unclassified Thermococcus]NJE45963.1 hypothetical protein [Thermococcus sp. GR7]NJE78456.1 hypothetical protein [Thermococcus sp. GR4]NJF22159.1 hypothetical protein [Thermococcus sp. GR5]